MFLHVIRRQFNAMNVVFYNADAMVVVGTKVVLESREEARQRRVARCGRRVRAKASIG